MNKIYRTSAKTAQTNKKETPQAKNIDNLTYDITLTTIERILP